jgi:hypothetical protein
MATQSNKRQPANLSSQQMQSGIPKIERRVRELKELDVNALTDRDADNVLQSLIGKIEHTLLDVFGKDTIEIQSVLRRAPR